MDLFELIESGNVIEIEKEDNEENLRLKSKMAKDLIDDKEEIEL